ncbi:MAG: 2,3,4,5-tetrahydropyridine-2,6-dicarboxylate N-acetyltransferase [Oscillospiraceae bacterium]|jgi:tetrahydrodipicolinate N-acetyltransferase|nr:2,3,4,5-tetrahydropyridine-2,6-dicarboxylate N-acetyltransferase [Oscillospiraceae bacterium]MDD7041433.1 2,3,4,5-tetrahydropyridine-2,6-dicarboxylate N-acetyltransferase [Oscillospiraceae bacterium]MDY2611743.1 2,3,4,5-tetrahydropyridine-2,6-dicarboxylate N-acetyltransferase [Oscillospiraceae bacterium]
MDAYQIIEYIRTSPKKTPVRVWLQTSQPVAFPAAQQFSGGNGFSVVFGDWEDIRPVLEENREKILSQQVENDARNSAIPLLDKKDIHARIEPGAIIREQVQIGDNAVIMMGAVINIGAVIGEGTMIDMGAVLGGRAMVGKRCHIGAGAVLAGVVEPPSATPVVVEDNVLIGANAVVIEGVRIGEGSVVAAGSVVIEDVASGMVVAGVPARVVKKKDEKSAQKTELIDALRELNR